MAGWLQNVGANYVELASRRDREGGRLEGVGHRLRQVSAQVIRADLKLLPRRAQRALPHPRQA